MKILLHCHVPFLLAHGGAQIQIEQTKAALEKIEKVHEKNTSNLMDVLLGKLTTLLREHVSAGVNNNFGEVQIGKGAKFTAKNLAGIDYLNVNPLGWTGDAKTEPLDALGPAYLIWPRHSKPAIRD